jgi:hypothetical protein
VGGGVGGAVGGGVGGVVGGGVGGGVIVHVLLQWLLVCIGGPAVGTGGSKKGPRHLPCFWSHW